MKGMPMSEHRIDRLRAGLDEDERIARAIDDKQADSGWSVSYNPYGLVNTPPGWYITPHIGLAYESEGGEHIARQNPKRTLAVVDALRRILTEYENALELLRADTGTDRESYLLGRAEAFGQARDILAGIYDEDPE